MFDHRFDHLHDHNLIAYRGVAQLVARDVWDVDAAGSNPVTPTKIGGFDRKRAARNNLVALLFFYLRRFIV